MKGYERFIRTYKWNVRAYKIRMKNLKTYKRVLLDYVMNLYLKEPMSEYISKSFWITLPVPNGNTATELTLRQ